MSNFFISKANREDIPSDAVLLTRSEVLDIHWNTIKNWKPMMDLWPFKIGIGVMAGINATTTLSIVNYYRTKLQLQRYGRITMILPTVLIPNMASTLLHVYFITNGVLLGESCPLCLQTKAAALQVSVGTLFPMVTAPIAGFTYALNYGTFRIPYPSIKNLPEIFKIYVYLTKNLRSRLPIAIFGNAIAASVLTYFEAKSFYHVQNEIYKKEEEFRKLSQKDEDSSQ